VRAGGEVGSWGLLAGPLEKDLKTYLRRRRSLRCRGAWRHGRRGEGECWRWEWWTLCGLFVLVMRLELIVVIGFSLRGEVEDVVRML
jgi:hypothetical protein